MALIDYEFNFILKWSANCVLKSSVVDQATVYGITGAKPSVSVLALSTLTLLVLSLKAMKNCLNSENKVLKEQLIGINISLKQQYKDKTNI